MWRVARLAAAKGLVLMPLLTNLVDDVWQPEAVRAGMGPDDKKNQFVVNLLSHSSCEGGGWWWIGKELDPQRKKEITDLLIKMADALHAVTRGCGSEGRWG